MPSRESLIVGHKPDWEQSIRERVGDVYDVTVGDRNWCIRDDWGRFDLIVPLTVRDGAMLRRAGVRLAGKALCPTASAVAFCHDKHGFNRALSLTRFRTMIPRLIDARENIPFPCILKKKFDQYGMNSFVVHSKDDIARLSARPLPREYFLQEYIAGHEERATHLLLRDGRIIYTYSVIYDMGKSRFVKGAREGHVAMEAGRDERFLDAFADILRIAGFTDGTCCFDYKVVDGVPKIFEVNPRFGWSLLYDLRNYLRAYAIAARA